MKFYYAEPQSLHAPATMIMRGKIIDSPEGPVRADILRATLDKLDIQLSAPEALDSELQQQRIRARLQQIHTPRYLNFLETIYQRWSDLPGASDIVTPNTHPCGAATQYPEHPVGLAGWHLSDMACPMGPDSFKGIMASAATAEAAAESVLAGEDSAYALCRPPGHHAGPELAGGFCYLNNSALAATVLREKYDRVAVVDVDLHHGNGTQTIFYERADVWTGSLHADTAQFYPFFWGHENETGTGAGQGFNVNMPLPIGTAGQGFLNTLEALLERLADFRPEAIVIALGLDAHKDDPLAGLALETQDFNSIGRRLADLNLPTVVVQEGGYPTVHLGNNLAAFLTGFRGV